MGRSRGQQPSQNPPVRCGTVRTLGQPAVYSNYQAHTGLLNLHSLKRAYCHLLRKGRALLLPQRVDDLLYSHGLLPKERMRLSGSPHTLPGHLSHTRASGTMGRSGDGPPGHRFLRPVWNVVPPRGTQSSMRVPFSEHSEGAVCPYVCGLSLCFPQVGVFIPEISCLMLHGIYSFGTAGQTQLCFAQMGKHSPTSGRRCRPSRPAGPAEQPSHKDCWVLLGVHARNRALLGLGKVNEPIVLCKQTLVLIADYLPFSMPTGWP